MAKFLKTFFALLALLLLCSCQQGKLEASRLIVQSQEARDQGDLEEAKEKLLAAKEFAPDLPEVYLELGILMDEYLHDTANAVPYYEKFLSLSRNEEMRAKVSSWLEDARQGISLPLSEVKELPPEAKELLAKRTEQFEELRQQLIDRYECELAKLRAEKGLPPAETVAETKTVSAVKEEAKESAEESQPAAAVAVAESESEPEKKEPSKEELKKIEKAKKEEAERLAREKKEREEKIDAFVKTMVKAGSEQAESTVISAASLPKEAPEPGEVELELSPEEKEPEVKQETAQAAPVPAEPEKKEEKGPRIHVVGQGDNLGNISRKYYGEFKRWKDIAEANKEILPDPNKLKIGMKLVIPE